MKNGFKNIRKVSYGLHQYKNPPLLGELNIDQVKKRACVKSWFFLHQIKWMRILYNSSFLTESCVLKLLDFQLINVNKLF